MPTYVYRFVDSGETIEVQQAFTDEPLTEALHPDTGAMKAVRKVFTPVGVTFKGGGFYKTDNRSSAKRSGSGDKATSAPGDGTSSSSDSRSSDSSGSSSGDSSSAGSSAAPSTTTSSSSTS
jgi:predicted nucleic acid-binding Zn ribbon protein